MGLPLRVRCICQNPVHNQIAAPRKDKTRWIISESHQFCIFEEADINDRSTPDGLFGLHIVDGKLQTLGENGEKLGFFPTPANMIDPWHGYPEKSLQLGDGFDKFFVSMRDAGELRKADCTKFLKKKL